VNDVVEPDEFDDHVREYAETIASKAPLALQLAKKCVIENVSRTGLELEKVAGAFLYGTKDQKEGMQAFVEDKEPEFEGQ